MAYTTDDIILWGKISQPFSYQNEVKTLAQNGSIDKDHHIKLYVERKSVEWYNSQADPDADILYTISNWLFALEGIWGLKAQFIDGGSGGQVAPVVPADTGSSPDDIDWLVSGTASQYAPLADGENFVILNGTGGMPDLRGYNINYFRGGVTQNITPLGDGSTYYSWNRSTGLLQLYGSAPANGAAQSGELMRITPDRTGGTSTVTNPNTPETIFLSADGTYTLVEGYAIWKITIKPTVADTIRIGTTLNGEEIMMDKLMVINTYANNGVTADVAADGANQTIYFTGFTGQAQINIYLLPIE